ncbi:alpha/beta fold hydrolase [Streptomyces umbrinus]|uniref:alpha/beta fold hydrolase n=1 Tax=Streptomyces umbrinus TaxID=67370 RepID=UPI0033CAC851
MTMDGCRDFRVRDIRCTERGQGRILLCLHGIASSSTTFAAQMAGLGDDRRIVAWDAPGFGESRDVSEPPGLVGYAAAAVEVIESLGAPVHLLGVAWGAAIACRVAHDRPDLLASLVLVSAGRGDRENPDAAAALRRNVRKMDEVGPLRFAEAALPRMLSGSATPAQLADAIGITASAVRPAGYAHAVESLIETDLRPLLPELGVSTLLLCGDEDPITGERESRALHSAIRDSVQVTVTGAGHLANQDRPDSVNEWIAAYLDIVEHLDGEKEQVHVG